MQYSSRSGKVRVSFPMLSEMNPVEAFKFGALMATLRADFREVVEEDIDNYLSQFLFLSAEFEFPEGELTEGQSEDTTIASNEAAKPLLIDGIEALFKLMSDYQVAEKEKKGEEEVVLEKVAEVVKEEAEPKVAIEGNVVKRS